MMPSGTEEEEEGPATTAMQKCAQKCLYVNERREKGEVDIGAGVRSVCRCVVTSKQTRQKEKIKKQNNHRVQRKHAEEGSHQRHPDFIQKQTESSHLNSLSGQLTPNIHLKEKMVFYLEIKVS